MYFDFILLYMNVDLMDSYFKNYLKLKSISANINPQAPSIHL